MVYIRVSNYYSKCDDLDVMNCLAFQFNLELKKITNNSENCFLI